MVEWILRHENSDSVASHAFSINWRTYQHTLSDPKDRLQRLPRNADQSHVRAYGQPGKCAHEVAHEVAPVDIVSGLNYATLNRNRSLRSRWQRNTRKSWPKNSPRSRSQLQLKRRIRIQGECSQLDWFSQPSQAKPQCCHSSRGRCRRYPDPTSHNGHLTSLNGHLMSTVNMCRTGI